MESQAVIAESQDTSGPDDPIRAADAIQANIYLNYSVWLKRQTFQETQLREDQNPYELVKHDHPIPSLAISSHWTFSAFKEAAIESFPDPDPKLVSMHSILHDLDDEGQLEWLCYIEDHPRFGYGNRFVATNTAMFRDFATAAAFSGMSGKKATVKLKMDKPEEVDIPDKASHCHFTNFGPP